MKEAREKERETLKNEQNGEKKTMFFLKKIITESIINIIFILMIIFPAIKLKGKKANKRLK